MKRTYQAMSGPSEDPDCIFHLLSLPVILFSRTIICETMRKKRPSDIYLSALYWRPLRARKPHVCNQSNKPKGTTSPKLQDLYEPSRSINTDFLPSTEYQSTPAPSTSISKHTSLSQHYLDSLSSTTRSTK